jgi:hypothetical protein
LPIQSFLPAQVRKVDSPLQNGTIEIKAPIIGRFYEKPEPGAACGSPKFKTGETLGSCATVDNFVTAKASSFNKIQQTSTSRPQTLQHQSLKINKNP